MMRDVAVLLPPDAVRQELLEIQIDDSASIYELKEAILKEVANVKAKDLIVSTAFGRRLVDRDSVSEIPWIPLGYTLPNIVVDVNALATTIGVTDYNTGLRKKVNIGLDCPVKVATGEDFVFKTMSDGSYAAIDGSTTARELTLATKKRNIELLVKKIPGGN